jgi:membrane-associated phospholipid phosphatase
MDPLKKPSFNKLIWDNKEFIIPFFVVTILSSMVIWTIGNHGLFLFVNKYYSDSADFFFLFITNFGDAIIAVLIVILLLWVSVREALTFLIITLLLAIIITWLKNYVFPELDRPAEVFKSSEILRLVEGYHPPGLCTFPSGHAATVFSIGLYMSILIKNRYTKFILFLIAFIVGYSRIYLSAHFPADILGGAVIAVPITIYCYILGRRIENSWIDWKITFSPKISAKDQTI